MKEKICRVLGVKNFERSTRAKRVEAILKSLEKQGKRIEDFDVVYSSDRFYCERKTRPENYYYEVVGAKKFGRNGRYTYYAWLAVKLAK